jgi:hypothetical protein
MPFQIADLGHDGYEIGYLERHPARADFIAALEHEIVIAFGCLV